jgi:hypothetical protein
VLSGDVNMEFIHVLRARANRDRIADQSAPIESAMDVVKVIGNSRAASRAARLRCVSLALEACFGGLPSAISSNARPPNTAIRAPDSNPKNRPDGAFAASGLHCPTPERARGFEPRTSSLGNDHFDRTKVLGYHHLMVGTRLLQVHKCLTPTRMDLHRVARKPGSNPVVVSLDIYML